MTIEQALHEIEKATSPKTFFGKDPAARYRELAKLVHPDTCPSKLKARGQAAFAKLSTLYAALTKNGGTNPLVIGKWIVSEPLAKGDIADLYKAEREGAPACIFKLARSPKDEDLMEAEAFALKYLAQTKAGHNYLKYLPTLFDSLEASGRRANVLLHTPDVHSLADIAIHYPKGLPFRHVVWMANRALSALGFIHRHGIVHGAVLPEHLLYGPMTHSLTLVDWCYSVTDESKRRIPAVVSSRKNGFYPPEVLRKEEAGSFTDIYMLFASLLSVCPKYPKRFTPLFDWCLAASPRARASEAFEVQDRWVALAKQEYGEPSYLELKLPVT